MKKIIVLSMACGGSYAVMNQQNKADMKAVISSGICAVRSAGVLANALYSYYEIKKISDEAEYSDKKSKVHSTVANEILKVCKKNQGVYVKIGQYIGSLEKVLPKEYTDVLKELQDQCPSLPFSEIKIVFEHDLGQKIEEVFTSFDENCIASASLAQVHRATLKNGQIVAVKLQYPALRTQATGDKIIIQQIMKITSMAINFFGFQGIDLYKHLSHFEESLMKELDFENELKNAEMTRINFINDDNLYIPKYEKNYCSNRVLTMEFIDGIKISDIQSLRENFGNTNEIGKQLLNIFGQMIFKHGHVHCDPHSGNILVRKYKNKTQIVLLDHGFYNNLDNSFRLQFCELWYNLCSFNNQKVELLAKQMGMGEYYRFLPILFTGRTINSRKKFGANWNEEDKQYFIENNENSFEKLSHFFQLLPREIIYIFRSSLLVAIHNLRCGGEREDRLNIFSKHCLEALSENKSFLQQQWLKWIFRIKIYLFQLSFKMFRIVFGFQEYQFQSLDNQNSLQQQNQKSKCPLGFVSSRFVQNPHIQEKINQQNTQESDPNQIQDESKKSKCPLGFVSSRFLTNPHKNQDKVEVELKSDQCPLGFGSSSFIKEEKV